MKIRVFTDELAKEGGKLAFVADNRTFNGIGIFHWIVKIAVFIERSIILYWIELFLPKSKRMGF